MLDAFDAVGRDGAGLVEVAIALQKRVAALMEHGDKAVAERAFAKATERLDAAGDRARLEAARAEGVRG